MSDRNDNSIDAVIAKCRDFDFKDKEISGTIRLYWFTHGLANRFRDRNMSVKDRENFQTYLDREAYIVCGYRIQRIIDLIHERGENYE